MCHLKYKSPLTHMRKQIQVHFHSRWNHTHMVSYSVSSDNTWGPFHSDWWFSECYGKKACRSVHMSLCICDSDTRHPMCLFNGVLFIPFQNHPVISKYAHSVRLVVPDTDLHSFYTSVIPWCFLLYSIVLHVQYLNTRQLSAALRICIEINKLILY